MKAQDAPLNTNAIKQHESAWEQLTVHLISHNHWDREWIFTARYTNRWLLPFFDNLLQTLEDQPAYRFVLDGQTAIIEDYLEQLSPEEIERRERQLSKFVKQGRLLVGPAYLQPDWTLVSGESLVRNLMIGHRIAERFGGVMKAGWMLDNFGQIAQAPQIYRGFGIDGVFVWRGVAMDDTALKSEFHWQSPDGSGILAIYLINSYRNAMVLSLTREIAEQRIRAEANALSHFATTPNVLLMNGYEQVPWPDDVLPIIEAFNQASTDGLTCVQSTPPEYLDAVRRFNPELPTLAGYLYSGRYMPVLKGVFSSRSQLKLMNNECQRELERWAEPFATVAWLFGAAYPAEELERAWKTLMLNHAHDDMCGCSIDNIARDMEARFAEVYETAQGITDKSLKLLAGAVDISKVDAAAALVVFNPSPRPRDEVVSFAIEIPASITEFAVCDGRGDIVPYQLVARDEKKASLYLYAKTVPPLGYKTFYVVAAPPALDEDARVTASAAERTLENDHLRVRINEDGTLDVTNKATGDAYAGLGYFEDGGDAGDTYDYSPPSEDKVISSRGGRAEITLMESGPLIARFRVAVTLELPEALSADRQSRDQKTRAYPIVSFVELTAGARRVEIKTRLHNVVKDHRLMVHFPTGIHADFCHAEEPFDVARMPIGEEAVPEQLPEQLRQLMIAGRYTKPVTTHPFQNFVDYNDGKKGVSVISRRVTEYEVLPEGGTIALTLLRCVGWLARYDLLTRVGDVGPHIFTPEAQCLGEHEFHYAIYPHSGDWSDEQTHLQAFSHNLKFRVMQTTGGGSLPDELGFLSLESAAPADAFRLTALKRAEAGDGVIVRFFNTFDKEVRGAVRTWRTEDYHAARANLNEEVQEELDVEGGTTRFTVRPKEIVTAKLNIEPARQLDYQKAHEARLLKPLPTGESPTTTIIPPVITREEVQAERVRVAVLEEALMKAKADAFTLEDDLERTASKDLARVAELQRRKTRVATLTRQLNESRISALLNRQLYITRKIESELAEIGESMSWSRTKKRAGEYLVHYYETLLKKAGKG